MQASWRQIGAGVYLLITGLSIGWLAGLSTSPVASLIITTVMGAAAAIVTAMSGLREAGGANLEQTSVDKTEHAQPLLRRSIKYSPLPLALLVLGLVIGVGIGIWTRTNNKLGGERFADLQAEINFWANSGDLDAHMIARRLYEQRYSSVRWSKEDLDIELTKWQEATGLTKEVIGRRLFESTYPTGTIDIPDVPVRPSETPDAFKQGIFFAVGTDECTNLKVQEGEILRSEMQSSTNDLVRGIASVVSDTQTLKQLVTEVLCVAGH